MSPWGPGILSQHHCSIQELNLTVRKSLGRAIWVPSLINANESNKKRTEIYMVELVCIGVHCHLTTPESTVWTWSVGIFVGSLWVSFRLSGLLSFALKHASRWIGYAEWVCIMCALCSNLDLPHQWLRIQDKYSWKWMNE